MHIPPQSDKYWLKLTKRRIPVPPFFSKLYAAKITLFSMATISLLEVKVHCWGFFHKWSFTCGYSTSKLFSVCVIVCVCVAFMCVFGCVRTLWHKIRQVQWPSYHCILTALCKDRHTGGQYLNSRLFPLPATVLQCVCVFVCESIWVSDCR